MSNGVEQIISQIERMCVAFLTPEQVRQVSGVVGIVLRDCSVTKVENALSTEFAISNEEYVRRFLALKTVKGCSERTIKLYAQTLQRFFLMITKPLPNIEANDIRAYLAIRERRDGLTKVTLNNELLHMRSFFHTMLAEEYITKDPTMKIDKIKAPKKLKKPFTELELEKVRGGCRDEKQRAIVEVLYSTGCRVSELVGIDRDEIDGDQVIVHGKGAKDRVCYLNPRARIAVDAYLKTRKDHEPALFVGVSVITKEITGRIDKGSVEQMLRRIGKRAGVENVHPHRFRRTAATLALRRGMPIDQVSKMLGHEQLSTTQVYAITDQYDLKRSHEKYML